MTTFRQLATKLLLTILLTIISFYLGYQYANITLTTSSPQLTTSPNDPKRVLKDTTEVTVRSKVSPDEPDLEVTNRYIAKVNGKTLEVPMETHKEDSSAKVSTEINLTPVVRELADKEYKRNWEVSTGLGRSHDGHWYVPIGIQRNYNYDKAIEVSIGLTHDHIETIQVAHKWKF